MDAFSPIGKTLCRMIREATPADFDAVVDLYRQLQPGDPVVDDGSDLEAYQEILTNPRLHILVLEVDGVVAATTYLNIIPNLTRSASPYAVIENVVVNESMRRSGLGRRIMEATLEKAWEEGCYKAMLMTGSSNPATHAFYESCGFSPDAKSAYLARSRRD